MTFAEQLRMEGRQEGRQEGKLEIQLEIALRLLKEQADINFIAKITGLTIDIIREDTLLKMLNIIKNN